MDADAWITWPDWTVTNSDVLEAVALQPDRTIWRDVNVSMAPDADPEALVEGTESWEDLLSTLGVYGWELVQVIPGVETTYWFKRHA